MKKERRLRPTFEDILRSLGYVTLAIWAGVFLLYTPSAFLFHLDLVTRGIWMSITFIGALMATLGSLSRIDLKLELPGLLITIIGPIFYALSQYFFVFVQYAGIYVEVHNRAHLVIYSLLPIFLLLPRTWALYKMTRQQKRMNAMFGKRHVLRVPRADFPRNRRKGLK